MVREIGFQSQVASYQRLLKWYLIPLWLTLSDIRVKWSNSGKGVAVFPTPWCSSYWKGSLLLANFTTLLTNRQLNTIQPLVLFRNYCNILHIACLIENNSKNYSIQTYEWSRSFFPKYWTRNNVEWISLYSFSIEYVVKNRDYKCFKF